MITPIEILRRKIKVMVLHLKVYWLQGKHRRSEHNLNSWMILYKAIEFVNKQTRLIDAEVHFPVCDDKFFAHVIEIVYG
jgi:hypothetical protein